MQSVHEKLEETIKSAGFIYEDGGVCSSSTLGGLQAFLNKTLKAYCKKIDFIDRHFNIAEKFHNIQIKAKHDASGISFENASNAKLLSDHLDFLKNLSIAQAPHYNSKVFNQPYTQQTAPQVLEFIRKLETNKTEPMLELYRAPGIYTEQDLLCYLLTLKYYAQKHKQDLALFLGSSVHTIGLCFNHNLNQWTVIDINKYPFRESAFCTDIGSFLFEGFNDDFADDEGEYEGEISDEEIVYDPKPTTELPPTEKEELECNDDFAEIDDDDNDGLEFSDEEIVYNPNQATEQQSPKNKGPECVAFETIFYVKSANKEASKAMIDDLCRDPILNTILIIPHMQPSAALIIKQSQLTTPNNTRIAYIAARYKNADVIKCLAEQNTDLDDGITDDESFPLYIASQQGNLEEVKELINGGAKINQVDARDYSPLAVAAQMGHLHIVKFLVEAGAEIQPTLGTCPSPIFVAALEDHAEIVKFLLENGANPETPVIRSQLLIVLGYNYGIGSEMKTFIEDKISNGCDPDKIPISAFELAKLKNDEAVLKIMESHLRNKRENAGYSFSFNFSKSLKLTVSKVANNEHLAIRKKK